MKYLTITNLFILCTLCTYANTTFYIQNINNTDNNYGQVDSDNIDKNTFEEAVVPSAIFNVLEGWKLLGVDNSTFYYQVTDNTKSNYGQIDTWDGETRLNYGNLNSIFPDAEIWELSGVDDGLLYFQITDQTSNNYGRIEIWDGSSTSYYGKLSDAFSAPQFWTMIGANQGLVYMQWTHPTVNYGDIQAWDGENRTTTYLIRKTYTNQFSYHMAGIDFLLPNAILFSSDLQKLKDHVKGSFILSTSEINTIHNTIIEQIDILKNDSSTISKAFDLVNCFETLNGALFTTANTANGFSRNPSGGLELERAMLTIQQALIDHAFTAQNLNTFPEVFENKGFETATYFPGAVDPPTDSALSKQVTINASHIAAWGTQANGADAAARRPTACYLAPGNIATVSVPIAIVGKGYQIRVGAHYWDLEKKNTIKRMDRISILYDVNATNIVVGNPLGGNIYIEVPYERDEGLVEINISNVVRAPFFSYKNTHKTTLSEWQNIERKHLGAWADFESDNFMMQVPTSWIYNFEDPQSLMQKWDRGIHAVSELLGRPYGRTKTPCYVQIDVIFRGGAFFPGYPMSNYPYNPNDNTDGNKNHNLLKGPDFAGAIHWHEHGHQENVTKFKGETEALVNFLYLALMNKAFDIDLNTAFKNSFSPELNMGMDDAVETRMITENFRQGNPRNTTNVAGDEVKYQHRGYAHYADIVDLFGWCALEDFWYGESEDYMNGITYNTNSPNQDDRIYRMSKAARIDLRPLFHFWGIHPENPANLASLIQQENLPSSSRIFDKLEYYKTLIPINNQAFNDHAYERYPNGFSANNNNPKFGKGWYEVWSPLYNQSHGDSTQVALQNIIDLYYPNGKPADLACNLCENKPAYKLGKEDWTKGTEIENFEEHELILAPGNLAIDGWSWTGPNGFTANQRTLNLSDTNNNSGDYIATYLDEYGCTTSVNYSISICNDIDKDAICDLNDNCTDFANPLQIDTNLNNEGDICETACKNFHNLSTAYLSTSILHFNAIDSINCNSFIEAGANIIFKAGESILLYNGFEAETQADFEVYIEACIE